MTSKFRTIAMFLIPDLTTEQLVCKVRCCYGLFPYQISKEVTLYSVFQYLSSSIRQVAVVRSTVPQLHIFRRSI
jgi:hypothetical protein